MISTPKGYTHQEDVVTARADDNVTRYLSEGTVAKEIYVPGRLVNFVVR